MKKNLVLSLFILSTVFISSASVSRVLAQSSTAPGTIPGASSTAPGTIPGASSTAPGVIPGTGTETPQKLEDPLGESTTIDKLLLSLFDIVFYIGVPLVAFFLIWSGFMFIAAQGKPEQLETAKSRLIWTIVGAILLLGAWTISQAIKGTIINIKKGATAYVHKHTFS